MLYVLSSYKLYYRGILIFSNLLHLLQLFGPKIVKHHNWTCEFFLPPNNFCFRRNEDSWNRLGFHYNNLNEICYFSLQTQQTLQGLVSTIQNLVENVVVSFSLQLVDHAGLFQQVWSKKIKIELFNLKVLLSNIWNWKRKDISNKLMTMISLVPFFKICSFAYYS